MFGLDHERLREGDREILDAKDEFGQILFSAGAGLSGLRDRLKSLTAEADERAGTLPFVADDLFIKFDDARAAAGFKFLASWPAKLKSCFYASPTSSGHCGADAQ